MYRNGSGASCPLALISASWDQILGYSLDNTKVSRAWDTGHWIAVCYYLNNIFYCCISTRTTTSYCCVRKRTSLLGIFRTVIVRRKIRVSRVYIVPGFWPLIASGLPNTSIRLQNAGWKLFTGGMRTCSRSSPFIFFSCCRRLGCCNTWGCVSQRNIWLVTNLVRNVLAHSSVEACEPISSITYYILLGVSTQSWVKQLNCFEANIYYSFHESLSFFFLLIFLSGRRDVLWNILNDLIIL